MTKANVNMRYCSILIIRDDVAPLSTELESALAGAGAETVLARSFAEARRHIARFDFSAAIIHYTPGSDDDFWQLIEELGGIPILLCCSDAPPPSGWHDVRFITMPACAEKIVNAVGSLLELTVH